MVRTSAVALIVCLLPLLATAQPGNRDARKPAAGETMRFSYNTGAPGAELNGHNKLFIRVTSYFQDGSLRTYHPRLRRVQKLFVAYFRIPKDAASLQAVFYDRTKDARRSATESPVYTRDTRVPVRGAFLQTLYTDKPDSIFLREIVRYTNNFLAYAKYINIVSMIRPDSSGQLQIAGLRRRLEYYYRHSRTTSNAGLLTALCIAAVKNGDPLAGKEYLTKALNDFPTSAESDFAFSIYNYEHYKASGRGPGEDILPLIKRIFMKYPAAEISRDPDVWNALKDDLSIPVEAFEKVRRATCRTGTLHYYDLNRLPELYIARRKKTDRCRVLLRQELAYFRSGSVYREGGVTPGEYQLYLSLTRLDLARLALAQKDYRQSVAQASMAMHMINGTSIEGNFKRLILSVRAEAYRLSRDYQRSIEDYRVLYNAAAPSIKLDSLRLLFSADAAAKRTFELFAASLKKRATTNQGGESAVHILDLLTSSIGGVPVRIGDFKDKIIVINLWSISCAPCVAEISQLNNLVNSFNDKTDVVFLGITTDGAEHLRYFLNRHPFSYTILRYDGDLGKSFGTNVLPAHIVIGKNGAVLDRSIGAREDLGTYLYQLIKDNTDGG